MSARLKVQIGSSLFFIVLTTGLMALHFSGKRQEEIDSALYAAVDAGDVNYARRLLREGANPNYAAARPPRTLSKRVSVLLGKRIPKHRNSSVLHAAVSGNDSAMVEMLIAAGANVNAQDQDGWTELLGACARNHRPMAQILLNAGADPNLAERNHGITPLLYATHCNNQDLVRLLLRYGADPRLPDRMGRTAEGFAQSSGHKELTEIMRSGGERQPVDLLKSTSLIAVDRTTAEQPPRKLSRPVVRLHPGGCVTQLQFSPNGRHLAVRVDSIGDDEKVRTFTRIYDARTWKRVDVPPFEINRNDSDRPGPTAVTRDGRLGIGMQERKLELAIWDMATRRLKRALPERAKVNGWAVSPDEKWIATAGDEWATRLWDLKTGRKAYLLAEPEAREPEWAVVFSSNGKLLAAGGKQGVVRVWKVPSR